MKPETLQALKESIAHWERIVDKTDVSKASNNCALCQRFEDGCVLEDDDGTAELCPVYEAMGDPDCYGTPYHDFFNASRAASENKNEVLLLTKGLPNNSPAAHTAAQAEVAFLKSLLPTEEPSK